MSSAGRGAAVRLRPADPPEIPGALAQALANGPPCAPLPANPDQRDQALAMLRPDEPVVEPDAAVVVSTSGSTGRPKGVVLSRRAIAASVSATHHHLGGPGDWVLALPAHYVAGVMVRARGLLAGTSVVEARSDLSDLAGVADRLEARRYLSIVPTQLARGLSDPETTVALAGFTAVLVGGGALAAELRDRARRSGVAVVTTYGMSETCGGCVYDGQPLAGVRVQVGPDERITLGGAALFSGYRLRPDLTSAALTAGGRLRTQDRGRWEGDQLKVLGRVDDVVVSGGLNVDLTEVERRARSWPPLAGAELVVIGVPDAEWGTKVVAVTEAPTDGTGVEDLRRFLAGTLPGYAAPRALVRLGVLPRTSSGKIDRPALQSLGQEGQS